MALITNFQDAGAGKLVASNASARKYRVGEETDYVDYIEYDVSNTRIWVGLNEKAATDQVALNVQPNEAGAQYAWSASEDVREVGSFTLERSYQKTSTVVAGSTPPPVMIAPTFSPAGSASIDDAFDQNITTSTTIPLTITANTQFATLYYKVQVNNWGFAPEQNPYWPYGRYQSQFVDKDFTTTAASSVSISLDEIAASNSTRYMVRTSYSDSPTGVKLDAVWKVTAYTVRVVGGVTYTSPVTIRYIQLRCN